MYVRFLGHATAKLGLRGHPVVRTGIFGTAYPLSRNEGVPDWLRAEVRRELDWFETHLPVPGGGVFWVKSQRRWRRQGLCWFRPDAGVMISHAFNLRALIEDYGITVDVVKTERPGSVLYRDAYQVVARPDTYRIRWRPRGSPRGRWAYSAASAMSSSGVQRRRGLRAARVSSRRRFGAWTGACLNNSVLPALACSAR